MQKLWIAMMLGVVGLGLCGCATNWGGRPTAAEIERDEAGKKVTQEDVDQANAIADEAQFPSPYDPTQ